MCAGGIVLARPDTVLWGVSDPKRGGGTGFGIFDHPGRNHHPQTPSVLMWATSYQYSAGREDGTPYPKDWRCIQWQD